MVDHSFLLTPFLLPGCLLMHRRVNVLLSPSHPPCILCCVDAQSHADGLMDTHRTRLEDAQYAIRQLEDQVGSLQAVGGSYTDIIIERSEIETEIMYREKGLYILLHSLPNSMLPGCETLS